MVVFEIEDGDKKTRQLLDEALAIAMEQKPPPDQLLSALHRDYAKVSMDGGNLDAVRHHLELSLAAVERFSGDSSLETALILFVYGQFQTAWDFEGGTSQLRRAIAILEAHHDPRASVTRAALARTLFRKGRVAEALPLYEAAIADGDQGVTPPKQLAGIAWDLAKALIATRGDRERARKLAQQAADYYLQVNELKERAFVLDWIKANRLVEKKP
jgi:tetratricopeptide (TPR) repeat protein